MVNIFLRNKFLTKTVPVGTVLMFLGGNKNKGSSFEDEDKVMKMVAVC